MLHSLIAGQSCSVLLKSDKVFFLVWTQLSKVCLPQNVCDLAQLLHSFLDKGFSTNLVFSH